MDLAQGRQLPQRPYFQASFTFSLQIFENFYKRNTFWKHLGHIFSSFYEWIGEWTVDIRMADE